jgi:hypothetical protein
MIQTHRDEVVAAGEPDLLAAIDADLAELNAWSKMDDQAFAAELKTRKNRGERLRAACMKKYAIPFTTEWSGYVGIADSTLASDGQFLYGTFGHGQTFCYDLDGNLKWGLREKIEKHPWDDRATFHNSPVLCQGVLIVKKRTTASGKEKAQGVYLGLEAATGKVLWEAALGFGYPVMKVMNLTAPDGHSVAVIIGFTAMESSADRIGINPNGKGPVILRVRDGHILGHLPNFATGRGALMTVHGDLVTAYSYADNFTGPDMAIRVRLIEPAKTACEVVWSHTDKQPRILRYSGFPTQLGDFLRNGSADKSGPVICDARDGSLVASLKLPAKERWEDNASGVLAGKHLFFWTDAYPKSNDSGRGMDGYAMIRFNIFDLSDPKVPKLVPNKNLLGYQDPPADLIVRTYLKEFDPLGFAGCYKGTPGYCAMMGGPVPAGNRLLIQTSAFLYGIGEK